MSGAIALAWRNRLVSVGWVLGFLLACRLLAPGREAGASIGALAAVGLGYGHLLGAAVFARGRTEAWAPAGVGPTLWRAFLAAVTLSLFAAYTTVAESGLLLLVLLGISIWHTVENDLGLEQAYREGLRPGPLPRAAEPHLLAVGLAALVLAVALSSIGHADRILLASTPARYVAAAPIGVGLRALSAACGLLLLIRRRRGALSGVGLVAAATGIPTDLSHWVSIGELFTASTLYHIVSWLVLSVQRVRHLARGGSAGEARVRLWRLVWTHAIPAALCAAVAFAPLERLAGVRLIALSPSLYLFFAALHVAHTTALRGPIARHRDRGPATRPRFASSGPSC